MKLKSYVNVNNIVNNIYIIIYIYKLKIILFNFMDINFLKIRGINIENKNIKNNLFFLSKKIKKNNIIFI